MYIIFIDLEVTNGSGCTDGETPHEGSSKLNVSGNNVGEQCEMLIYPVQILLL